MLFETIMVGSYDSVNNWLWMICSPIGNHYALDYQTLGYLTMIYQWKKQQTIRVYIYNRKYMLQNIQTLHETLRVVIN